MRLFYPRCAGLDIHKKTVVAYVHLTDPEGGVTKHSRTFGTTWPDLLELSDWLRGHQVTHAAMESTGVYWRPVYQALEGSLSLVVANPAHISRMPGRKTDLADADWLAELMRHGLVQASFVPPKPQRELRELTRHRINLASRRAQLINEMHRTLEGTNLKLTSVATDLTGVSATLMLQALLGGQEDPEQLAALARGRLRSKIPELRKALQGTVGAHQQLILNQLLAELELVDQQITKASQEIARRLEQDQALLERLDEIPGVNHVTAEVLLAELGTDMSRFGKASRAAAWSGLCPGNKQSGGRCYAARSRTGNRALKRTLTEAGRAAGRSKDSYLGAQYRRLKSRRGAKRAALAVGHSILTISYHMIERGTAYQDLGADYFDRAQPKRTTDRLVQRLEKLGYKVSLEPLAQVPPAAPPA